MFEEYSGLRASEKKLLGITFKPNREEVVEGWIKLHSLELNNLHASINIIRLINRKRKDKKIKLSPCLTN
jgi:hypothetical protein